MGWVQDEKSDYYGVSLKNPIFRGGWEWVNKKLIYRGGGGLPKKEMGLDSLQI